MADLHHRKGYSKLLNHHPTFDGISFTELEEDVNGIPIWMKCTIYHKDQSQPMVVTEYFQEIKVEQTIWRKIYRRKKWYRLMQLCAKLTVEFQHRQPTFNKLALQ